MQRRDLLKGASVIPMMSFGMQSNASEPTKPKEITVYHPFEPSPYDTLSLAINKELARVLGVKVNFEYGLMGRAARVVSTDNADGSNLYFAALGPTVMKPNIQKGALLPSDFRALCRMTLLPIIVVARKDAPYKTFMEFESYARKNPGKVKIALTNFPSSIHSGMTYYVRNLAKLDCSLITQPNSPLDGAIDTLLGETDVLITHTSDAERFIKHGDFVPLVTFNKTRLSMLPEVPTLREFGYNYDQTSWRVILVNKKTPDDVFEKLSVALKEVSESKVVNACAEEHWEPIAYLGPEETEKFLESELKFYEKLTRDLGIHY